MSIDNDKAYWPALKWPAAPNDADYGIFEQYCKGRVLLLGSTKMLLPLCTQAWDINPVYDDPKILARDWFSIDSHWDTVIVDGALAFGKDYCEKMLKVILPNCDRFIARAFLNPNWPTKYACYFPRAEELDPQPQEHPVNKVYSFYIWNNQQS
jgi:hypothetical protein